MNEFVIFKFRPDLLDKIKAAKENILPQFQEYGLTRREIALVWAILNDIDDPSEITIYNFGDSSSLQEEKKQYITDYNNIVKSQKEADKKFKSFIKKLKGSDREHTPFAISRNDIVINYGTVNLVPTQIIPMIKTNEWIKLIRGFTNYPDLKDFLDGTESGASHVFKIPGIDKGKVFDFKKSIEISVDPKDTDRIVNLIRKEFRITDFKWFKEYINGTFTIPDTNFDWNVMAMMLVEKDFYDETIFLVEDGNVLSKKDRFTLKYYKYGPENENPVFFTISNVKNDLVIKIAKISDEESIEIMINVLLSVLYDYIEEEDTIIDIFKAGISGFKTKTKAKKVAEKQVKTKQRLDPLKIADPEVFGGNYMGSCMGPKKQPRIPTEKEAKILLRDKPDEIIEFPFESGKFYTCNPIEAKPDGSVNAFPGLVKIKGTDKIAPCCYPKSHHAKPNSLLNQYIGEQNGLTEKAEKKISDNILGSEKRLPERRRGYLSERLEQLLNFVGLDPKDYIRYGVHPGPQSIIDAMAMIDNYDEWFKNPQAQKEKVVKKLLKSNILPSASQSYSVEYLRNALRDDTQIIGTAEFHPVLEYFFKATVLVIRGSDVARPESKFGFISHLRKRDKMLILYMHTGYEQVEVIGTYKKEFLEYPDESINSVLNIKRKCYSFYSSNHYKFPRISDLSNRATAQYIDTFGKNRGFLVDGQSIFMPPSAPTGKPIVKELYIEDTDSLIKDSGEKALYYKDGIVYTQNFALPTDGHKDLPLPPDNYVMPYIIATSNFIQKTQKKEAKAETSPFIKKLQLDGDDILTIFPIDEAGYLDIIRSLPVFKWEKLSNLVHNAGQIHWVSIKSKQYIVRDIDDKSEESDREIGTWSVALNDKVSDSGQYIEYPNGKFGVILAEK